MRNIPVPSPLHTNTHRCSQPRKGEEVMCHEPAHCWNSNEMRVKQLGGGRNAEFDVHLSSSHAQPKSGRKVTGRVPYHWQKYFVRKSRLFPYKELEQIQSIPKQIRTLLWRGTNKLGRANTNIRKCWLKVAFPTWILYPGICGLLTVWPAAFSHIAPSFSTQIGPILWWDLYFVLFKS